MYGLFANFKKKDYSNTDKNENETALNELYSHSQNQEPVTLENAVTPN